MNNRLLQWRDGVKYRLFIRESGRVLKMNDDSVKMMLPFIFNATSDASQYACIKFLISTVLIRHKKTSEDDHFR